MGTIVMLWQRQMKRYLRSTPRMVGSLGQPILFLLAFGFGFGPIFARAGQGDYLTFLAPGVIAMSVLFTAMFMGIEVIWDRQFGFLKETLVAPISRMRIMIGRTLGGATVAVAQGLVVFIITFLIGFRPHMPYLPIALLFLFLIGICFTALGTAIASLLQDMQAFPLIINFIIMPLFFLSGALFPLGQSPGVFERIAFFNPLAYGVDGLRGSLTLAWHFGLGLDLLVLGAITALLFGLGSYLFSKIQI